MEDRFESVLTEIDYGAWEGLSSEEIASQWPREYADWTEKSAWAEDIFEGTPPLSAIEEWIACLKNTHRPGETVLGVSSNGLIRFFYALSKQEWDRLSQERQMEALKVKTGHFCELLLGDRNLEIKRWNASPQSIQTP